MTTHSNYLNWPDLTVELAYNGVGEIAVQYILFLHAIGKEYQLESKAIAGSNLECAAKVLDTIEFWRTRYPNKKFNFHPSVTQFVHVEGIA